MIKTGRTDLPAPLNPNPEMVKNGGLNRPKPDNFDATTVGLTVLTGNFGRTNVCSKRYGWLQHLRAEQFFDFFLPARQPRSASRASRGQTIGVRAPARADGPPRPSPPACVRSANGGDGGGGGGGGERGGGGGGGGQTGGKQNTTQQAPKWCPNKASRQTRARKKYQSSNCSTEAIAWVRLGRRLLLSIDGEYSSILKKCRTTTPSHESPSWATRETRAKKASRHSPHHTHFYEDP